MDIDKTLQKLHIDELNDMQRDTMDAVLHSDRDVVVLAPTGSGKTLAYLLPLASRLDPSTDEVQAVVIVPGRELAWQSDTVFKSMGSGLRSEALYGGRTAMLEHRIIKETRPQIIFCTPGRLNDHIEKLNFSTDSVRWLVLDEFDKCLRMGFRAEMQKAVESLPNVERRILLSATDTDEMPGFVNMGRTTRIDYRPDDEQTPDRISLYTVRSPEKDKLDTLKRLVYSLGGEQTIVFMNHRDGVERVADFFKDEGLEVCRLHGGLDQRDRETAVYRFANQSATLLVGTDLAARGLDIPNVQNIIHYNLPVGEDEYIHRVGRTGRWDATGRAFMILGPGEQLPDYVKETTEEFAMPPCQGNPPEPRMATLYIGKGKKDKISKGDILGFLCKTCGVDGSDIGRIDVYERYAYAAVAYRKARAIVKKAAGAKIKGLKTVVELAF